MTRLPQPGTDDGIWGDILNDFLSIEHNPDGTLKPDGTLATKANDADVVHLTGAENIAGAKTFSTSPIVPDVPSGNSAAVNKSYVDTAVASAAGAVTSVNASTGAVVLDASDVGADASGSAATAIATAPGFVRYDTGSSSWPVRATATSDSTRSVIWIGPVAPSIGGSGAIDNVDVWWKTP